MSSPESSSDESSATVTEQQLPRRDVEAQKPNEKLSYWKRQFDLAGVTPAVMEWKYRGSGTTDDPFIVDFLPEDPKNPMKFSTRRKWGITGLQAIAVLAVTFVSTAYSGGIGEVIREFGVSEEIAILGISLFVLGFAVGYVSGYIALIAIAYYYTDLSFIVRCCGLRCLRCMVDNCYSSLR